MRIEIWLDYLCPVAYLTHKNLIEALEELQIKDYQLLYRSYEMIDYCGKEYNIKEVWEDHHYVDLEQVKFLLQQRYPNYKKLKFVDVNGAHQLSHLAKRYNVAQSVNSDILSYFFEKNKDISDINILVEIGEKNGLDKKLIKKVVSKKYFSEQIQTNRENAFLRGIDKIPHIRINIKNNYNGYYTKEELKQILCENSNKINKSYCDSEECCKNKAF